MLNLMYFMKKGVKIEQVFIKDMLLNTDLQ